MDLPPLPAPDDPEAALAAVVALRRIADRLEQAAVVKAVSQGWSWSDVADALGVTKQAVHKRFAEMVRAAAATGEE